MTDSVPTTEQFERAPHPDAEEEFEPADPTDPEEPETIPAETDPSDPGEADAADVADQESEVHVGDEVDDGYDRDE